jgi:hypothetical protein
VRRLALLLPFLFVLTACPEKQADHGPTPPPSGSTATSTVADAAASAAASASASPDAGGKAAAHMAHCPSAVEGSTVAIKDVEGGVEVSVTGKSDAETKEIRSRMAKLVTAAKNEADAGVHHTGRGEGGGRSGRCTIVMKNTKVESSEIPNGAKAKVTAKDKSEVDWLRRETRDRDKESKTPGAAGAGTHKMANCPAAVEGAKTAVKDAKDGVVVTVTGPADKVAEIRSRAKHIADVAKKGAPATVTHTGQGTGGGGIGRCPIDPEGDDTVDVKEVAGGIEATVKTKKDVAALQKETKERAANFGAK